MKTGAILTSVVAIAAAAPAAPTVKGSSVPSDAIISARQDGNWHIGCEGGGKDHKCSYYKDGAKIEVRSEDYDDAPMYNAPPSLEHNPAHPPAPYGKPPQSEGPHGGKPKGPHGGKPESPQGGPSEGPQGGPSEGPQSGPSGGPHGGKPTKPEKPEENHGGKPAKPLSTPFCDFVESECVDCNEHPDECDTCNFMFKCGEKKQCTYHGFRETMTLCKEIGEQCPWPSWSEDEYEAPEDKSETPQGGKPENPHGGKPEEPHDSKPDHSKVPEDESKKPEDEYAPVSPHNPHGPKNGTEYPEGGEHPHGPEGGENPHGPEGGEHPHGPEGVENPYGPKPVDYPHQGPKNGTDFPHGHGPDSYTYGPDGKKDKSS